jgi:hypothetical protein
VEFPAFLRAVDSPLPSHSLSLSLSLRPFLHLPAAAYTAHSTAYFHLSLFNLGPPQHTTPVARAPIRRPRPQAARAAPPASTTPPRPSPAALHAPAASTKTWLLRRVAKGAQG